MSERSRKMPTEAPSGAKAPLDGSLASQALPFVAKRTAVNATEIDLVVAARLHDAAADASVNMVPDVLNEMQRAGILPETIASLYIPHAARQMGDDWCDDTLSFARVTIGTARLQSSLRVLGTDWASHGYSDDDTNDGGVVIIVAKDAFHTLGAMVLCGQLRRMGLSVRLAMGTSAGALRTIFQTTDFDAVLISASISENLGSLRACVNIIRKSAAICPPIVIGGTVLDQDADVKEITGADFTTKDPFEALELCGIPKTTREDAQQQERRI